VPNYVVRLQAAIGFPSRAATGVMGYHHPPPPWDMTDITAARHGISPPPPSRHSATAASHGDADSGNDDGEQKTEANAGCD